MAASTRRLFYPLLLIALAFAGCPGESDLDERPEDPDEEAEAEPEPEEPRVSERLRIEVVLSERVAHIILDGQIVRTEPVAVGHPDHPTPTGSWHIHKVDWNPDWRPPDSEWAEDFDYMPPGDPDNPMGRVRMIFSSPYSIHGTDDLASLGEAASHGSIRMGNEAAIEVAEEVMRYGGVVRPAGWFERVLDDPTEMVEIELGPVSTTALAAVVRRKRVNLGARRVV